MFEDHLYDLFGLEIEEWTNQNEIIAEFIHWSEVIILPDDQIGHSESLARNFEESEVAVNFSQLYGKGNITITLNSAKIVDKSLDFPKELILQLMVMSKKELTNHQFLSDNQVGELA